MIDEIRLTRTAYDMYLKMMNTVGCSATINEAPSKQGFRDLFDKSENNEMAQGMLFIQYVWTQDITAIEDDMSINWIELCEVIENNIDDIWGC